jgi:hypothetical protein
MIKSLRPRAMLAIIFTAINSKPGLAKETRKNQIKSLDSNSVSAQEKLVHPSWTSSR